MKLTPATIFNILNIVGLSLMFVNWLQVVDTEGFLLLAILAVMCIVRYSFDHRYMNETIFIDLFVMGITFFIMDRSMSAFALYFLLFQSMYWGLYPIALLIGCLPLVIENSSLVLGISVTLIGLVLNLWKNERRNRLEQRDYALTAGADGYLLKTDETETLAVKLRTLMAGSGILDPDVLKRLTRLESPLMDQLSTRERDIARLVAQGLTNKEIAAQLFLSEGTIRNKVLVIMEKLGVTNSTQLGVAYYDK